MRRPIAFLLAVLTLLVLVLGILITYPGTWLRPVLQANLASSDFQIMALESVSLGLQSSRMELLALESPQATILIRGAQAGYNSSQLLAGELESVQIQSLEIRIKEEFATSGNPGEAISYPEILNTVTGLPLNSIAISAILLTTSQGELTAALDFQTDPLFAAITGNWTAEDLDDDLAILLQTDSPNEDVLNLTVSVGDANGNLLEAASEFLLYDSGVEASGNLTLNAQSMLTALGADTAAGPDLRWALLNDLLQLDFRAEIMTQTTEPEVLLVQVQLDTAGSELQVEYETADSTGMLELGMPITLTVSPDRINNLFLAQLTDSYGNLTWIQGENQVNVEAFFGSIQARCETWRNCIAQSKFGLSVPDWQFAGASSENLRTRGGLRMELRPDFTEISGEEVVLELESGTYGDWNASGTFAVEQLLVISGAMDRGSFRAHSNTLSIGSDQIDFNQPVLSSTVNFSAEQIAAVFDLAMGEDADPDSPLLRAAIDYSPEDESGALDLTLNEIQFSEQRPASSLITQDIMNMDVIAGSLRGSANLDLQASDSSWQVSGPTVLELNALSGHIEDTLLVGFSTQASSNLLDWTHLSSDTGLRASIDVVDIGLPLRNVQWLYSFDTARQEILVRELSSELFGGKVEIADFRLNPDNLDQDLTVVVSSMDLKTIVDLAEYPQLFVDGLISGYIPLTLNNGQILVNDGLIGALSPGGSIRYTPSVTGAAVNQSVQLLNQALSNYQYQTLDTRVFYDQNGDLRMEVQLQGTNPDMNGGQPINLNVNVTDNIPSLLRSLKAGQDISDRLEQRIRNRR